MLRRPQVMYMLGALSSFSLPASQEHVLVPVTRSRVRLDRPAALPASRGDPTHRDLTGGFLINDQGLQGLQNPAV